MKRSLLLVFVLALLAAGCGKSENQANQSGTTTAPPPTTQPPTGTTAPGQAITLKVYFLRDGKVAAAARQVPATQAVGRVALDALVQGPTAEERAAGLKTAIPTGADLADLSIENKIAKLSVGGSLSKAAQAQLAYTLTQFPTVKSVELGGKQLTRGSFERLTPAIFVESPVVGETVTSPLRIRGTANTFEANFQVELRAGGRRLVKGFATATSGSGTRGTYDVSIPFKLKRAADGVLIVYEPSAATGRPINVVRIPVRVAPS